MAGVSLVSLAASDSSAKYTSDNRLTFPADYREWIFLSAGRGMTYGPAANPNGAPLFDNVFVHPAAYREFLKTGRWPDKSVFVLEVREAWTEGSINTGGQFQRKLVHIEVEVKDQKRFSDSNGWGYLTLARYKSRPSCCPRPSSVIRVIREMAPWSRPSSSSTRLSLALPEPMAPLGKRRQPKRRRNSFFEMATPTSPGVPGSAPPRWGVAFDLRRKRKLF